MRNKIIFILVLVGVLGSLWSAYVYAVPDKPLPPAFNSGGRPLRAGHLSPTGSSRATQSNGENIEHLPGGAPAPSCTSWSPRGSRSRRERRLSRSTTRSSGRRRTSSAPRREAAQAMLEELRAQPRKENLEVARAQVEMAQASLKTAKDQLDKQQSSYDLDPRVGQQGRVRQRAERGTRSPRPTSTWSRGSTS